MSIELLVECARVRPNAGALRRAAARVADWDTTLAQADSHCLTPLLYRWMHQVCGDTVPERVMHDLRTRFHANVAQNLRLSAELVRIVAAFDAARIDVLPFKGPSIAWSLYETPALRHMSDLDILVRPQDVRRAIEMLAAHGYESAATGTFFSAGGELPLRRGPDEVDLHWELAAAPLRRALDVEGVWARRKAVMVAGRSILTLGTQDLLLFLCVHAIKHGWTYLRDAGEIARLLAAAPINWDAVLQCADRTRSTRVLFLGLVLARDIGGAVLPESVTRRVDADAAIRALALEAKTKLLTQPAPDRGAAGLLRWKWKVLEHSADRLRLCSHVLQPTFEDWKWRRLPRAIWPVYYVIRPARLLVEHGVPAARRALGLS